MCALVVDHPLAGVLRRKGAEGPSRGGGVGQLGLLRPAGVPGAAFIDAAAARRPSVPGLLLLLLPAPFLVLVLAQRFVEAVAELPLHLHQVVFGQAEAVASEGVAPLLPHGQVVNPDGPAHLLVNQRPVAPFLEDQSRDQEYGAVDKHHCQHPPEDSVHVAAFEAVEDGAWPQDVPGQDVELHLHMVVRVEDCFVHPELQVEGHADDSEHQERDAARP
mmetsp:Transcript_13159/g.41511  ORF Transcript_13159/g.41511 Transcript_13159/m.41511 type:complete len:218 (-) Transcript_13159:548-1201(-)